MSNQRLIKIKPVQLQKNDQALTGKGNLSTAEERTLINQELENAREELRDIEEKKNQMLQSIEEEIKSKKEHWEEEKSLLIKQAHQKGYEKGFQQGENEGIEKYTQKIKHVNDLVKITTKDYHKTLEKSDQMIIDLAVHMAGKIIKEQMIEQPKHYLTIVNEAIQEIKDQSVISIYTHPTNYELLIQQKEELMVAVDGDTQVSIFIDQKMSKNNCLIEHQFGQIDASVDTQLEQIKEALYQVSMEKKT